MVKEKCFQNMSEKGSENREMKRSVQRRIDTLRYILGGPLGEWALGGLIGWR